MRHVPVAIVGAGPNGVTLANLLGTYGITAVLIERSTAILPFPRAVGIDDEALRVFQAAGLVDSVLADAIQNVPMRMFDAQGRCFADIRPRARDFGWWRRNIFMQQVAERALRAGLERYADVELRLGEEVVGLTQDKSRVTLQIRAADDHTYMLTADYCVAADGGRSPIRELLGIAMEGRTLPLKWVVADVRNAPAEAPYTALNCDPRRPNVCIYLPYQHRRWEFMVFPHEDHEEIAKPESLRRLIAPYVADAAAIEIVHARTYIHHSRVASRFVVGRVALVGDAAHLSQPWIGQGLNAGLRDVGNVAWKIAGIVRGQLDPVVLASYDTERRRHAKAMVDLSDTFGRLLMPTHRGQAWLRDCFFRLVRFWPGLRDHVLQMRFKPMPRYENGVIVPSEAHPAIGTMFIQPDVEDAQGRRRKLDDVLGSWFAILGWRVDPQATLEPPARAFWLALGARFVCVDRSRTRTSEGIAAGERDTHLVEDVDNQLADWFEAHPGAIVVLRPDRYVAAQSDAAGLHRITEQFQRFGALAIRTEEAACT